MSLNRDLASAQLGTYLLVKPASDDQSHDLPLATSERSVTFAEYIELGRPGERYAAVLDRAPDRMKQHVDIEGFGEEFDCSSFHRTDRSRNVPMAGEKDHRHLASVRG